METEIKFEPSGRSGLVPVGTYLSDAAARLGVEFEVVDGETILEENSSDSFVVTVKSGGALLSPVTAFEIENLSESQRHRGRRLAAHAKIEREGEIVVMVAHKEKPKEDKHEKKASEFRKEFEELPLEKKVADLLELEAITLSETFSFVLNSPFKIFGKIMDVMAELGLKMEDDAKRAKRPTEHRSTDAAATGEKKKRAAKGKTNESPIEAS